MIVDPDFCDHWKTRMLVGALDGDEAAPMYVLRLWAHCQNRRQWQFDNLSPEALKALCRFSGPANKLESSLSASGFVRRDAKILIVVGWDKYNSALIASWTNGRLGGRPKKPPDDDAETPGKPTGIPTGKPPDVARHLDSSLLGSSSLEIPESLNEERFLVSWKEWIARRKKKRWSVDETCLKKQLELLAEVGIEKAIEAIEMSIRNGWQGLFPKDGKPVNGKDKTSLTADERLAKLKQRAKEAANGTR